MSNGLFDSLLDSLFDQNRKGREGEILTEFGLEIVRLFGRKGRVLGNVYVPKGDSETAEIDLLYITQKGIFVLESKNFFGWIFGDEDDRYWTVTLPNGEKHRFYNPVMQNRSHIKWLERFVGEEIPFFSLIVFSNRCELKKVRYTPGSVYVIRRLSLYAAIRRIWNDSPDVLTEAGVDELYEKLQPLTRADEAVKRAHIENVRAHYQGTGPKEMRRTAQCRDSLDSLRKDKADETSPPDCPWCGGKLVIRTARKGANAGRQFYGCSNYPKCRYTQSL